MALEDYMWTFVQSYVDVCAVFIDNNNCTPYIDINFKSPI